MRAVHSLLPSLCGSVLVIHLGACSQSVPTLASSSANSDAAKSSGGISSGLAAATTSSSLDAAEIVGFKWYKDPDYAGGVIKWNVEVRNKSPRNIRHVKVEFTTYDDAGQLVATAFAYTDAIPPNQTRAEAAYIDLHNTDKSAKAVISEVNFDN